MSRWRGVWGAALAAGLLCGSALADVSHTTSYSYYQVNGRTTADIYRAILSRGQR